MRGDLERMRDIQAAIHKIEKYSVQGTSPTVHASIQITRQTIMLTLETAIQKIQQLPVEQRNKVIEFIEFLEFQANQRQKTDLAQESKSTQEFFELAGIWQGRDITTDSIRSQAWGENK